MDIKEIEKYCKWKWDDTFSCINKKIENGYPIYLWIKYYKNVKAMRLIEINYGTCSPPWEDIKQSILAKYAPKSYRYIDYSDVQMVGKENYRQQINFYAGANGRNEDGLEDLHVGFRRDVSSCPGGLYLGFNLSSKFDIFQADADELYKRISEDAAKKTPTPKF